MPRWQSTWTPERLDVLATLRARGFSIAKIASLMDCSQGAIENQIEKTLNTGTSKPLRAAARMPWPDGARFTDISKEDCRCLRLPHPSSDAAPLGFSSGRLSFCS